MNKKYIYISILTFSVLGFLIFEWAKPKQIDWRESYSGYDKSPYGCFILRDILSELFPEQRLHYRNTPIVMGPSDSLTAQNAIFINRTFSPDSIEAIQLHDLVISGKKIFIAARTIQGELADTLNIETNPLGTFTPVSSFIQLEEEAPISFYFTNDSLNKKDTWNYDKHVGSFHFTSIDTLKTIVLGKNSTGDINYIKIKRGKGAFYLHAVPFVFTNFYMRNQKKAEYAFKALSYLPVASTVWDEYNKVGRSVNTSPLRYIVSQRYLRWAWITTLASLCLFLIFKAKRRQRVIPKLEQAKNTTLEFATTIGRLYQQNSSHKDIASKRIKYLREYIRENLNLHTSQVNENLIRQIAQRSGVNAETVETLFNFILDISEKSTLSSNELWQLNDQIENFYNQSSR